jgi:hypothetical protein
VSSNGSPEFGLSGYRKLVTMFAERGYRFGGYEDVEEGGRTVIMRHDVDLCVQRARRLAEAESEMGVSASYFFLVSTEFYNLHARDCARSIKAISDMGHQVGLHFDVAAYDTEPENLAAHARAECEALSGVTGEPVEIISFHRPLPHLQGMKEDFAGRVHTYQPRFFSEIDYCSDSGGTWAYGHPMDRESIKRGAPMQLVTHPIWWTGEAGDSPVQRVRHLFKERTAVLRSELQRNLAKGPFSGDWLEQLG